RRQRARRRIARSGRRRVPAAPRGGMRRRAGQLLRLPAGPRAFRRTRAAADGAGRPAPSERSAFAVDSIPGAGRARAHPSEERISVYLDRRLWAFTEGVRLRIAWTVLIGLLAGGVGIGRLALRGWLLARVIARDPLASLVLPAGLAAAAMLLRSVLEYWRAMVAHHTAAIVQGALRRAIYGRVAALGPAHFTQARTGDVALSMVEGVQQLEVYFGQYIPQLAVAAVTPFLIFACVAFIDLPIALVLLVAAVITLIAPAAWHRMDSRNSRSRQKAYSAFGAEFLDSVQGLATLKAFGQSSARAKVLEEKGHALFQRTMGVLGTNTLARGITDTGIAVGAAVALGWGAYRVRAGEMDLGALLIILMLGVEVFRPLR